MNTLEDRVAWALGYIKKEEKITNIQLSRILEVDKNTVQAYCHGKGTLKGSALAVIVKVYGFNGEWLMAGKGEPFLGASEKFPEVCGKPPVTPAQIDQITKYVKENTSQGFEAREPTGVYHMKINTDEAMGKAYKVLNAGTPLSVALYMNIQQFAVALESGEELTHCKEKLNTLEAHIESLQRQVDRLSAAPATTEGQGDGSVKKAM